MCTLIVHMRCVMYKPESIAKAELKGAFRRATERYEEFMNMTSKGMLKFGSRKNHIKYLSEMVKCRGEFLLDQRICHAHVSWHFHSLMTSFESELQSLENIGNVTRLVVDGWDSRRIMKGEINGVKKYLTRLYVHEHFLIRIIQRLGLEGLRGVSKQVFPLFSYILMENLSFRSLGKSVQFVMPNHVLIAEKLSGGQGLVFKTILQREFFSEEQQKRYEPAYWMMNMQKCNGVMLNQDTGYLTSLMFSTQGMSREFLKESFWMRDILHDFAHCA